MTASPLNSMTIVGWEASRRPSPRTDVLFEDHGSIYLFRPFTQKAMNWIGENVAEDAQFFGEALAVEPRYAEALIEGMIQEGLTIL